MVLQSLALLKVFWVVVSAIALFALLELRNLFLSVQLTG
jgi:hypothetical protein